MTDLLSAVLRALSFVLLFQAAGIAIFVAIFGRQLTNSLDTLRHGGQLFALAALLLVSGHYALEAARMAGELSGMMDPSLQKMVWSSSSRLAWIARLVGLLLIAVGLQGTRVLSRVTALCGVVLVTGAFALTGHTSVNAHRWALAGLLMVHLLIVAFWFGALWPLYLASLRETALQAAQITERFTAMATWLVPLIFVAGLGMALILLPGITALSEPYGLLLIAKVAGFTVLMGLAAANKWRLGPALAREPVNGGRWFRRSLAGEYVLIAAVLTVTAVMTSFFSPEA